MMESLHIVFPSPSAYFFVLRPVTLPQPGLGRIGEQVLQYIAKIETHLLCYVNDTKGLLNEWNWDMDGIY